MFLYKLLMTQNHVQVLLDTDDCGDDLRMYSIGRSQLTVSDVVTREYAVEVITEWLTCYYTHLAIKNIPVMVDMGITALMPTKIDEVRNIHSPHETAMSDAYFEITALAVGDHIKFEILVTHPDEAPWIRDMLTKYRTHVPNGQFLRITKPSVN